MYWGDVSPNITHKIRKIMSYLVPADNLHRHRENMRAPHTEGSTGVIAVVSCFLVFCVHHFFGTELFNGLSSD